RECSDARGATKGVLAGKLPPFDYARGHLLYKSLFAGIESILAGKQLLVVPSGPLTQLPLQVLVTEPSQGDDPRHVSWLIRKHALTVLPAVTSLKALRRDSRRSKASKPLLAFANPLLDGDQANSI